VNSNCPARGDKEGKNTGTSKGARVPKIRPRRLSSLIF